MKSHHLLLMFALAGLHVPSVGAAELAFVDKLVRGAELSPVSITTNAAGHAVVDFGKHGFGWIEVDAEKAGDYLFVWGEYLNEKGTVETNDFYTVREGNIRCAVTHGTFAAPGKGQRIPYRPGNGSVYHPGEIGPFGTVMPFRWLEVVKCPFAVTKDNVRQVPVYYPYDMTEESFACDNANLMKVHDFCKHTIRATTYTGKFIDGDRERLPYEADSWITLMSTYAVTSDDTLARRMVDYLATHTTWPTEWKQFFIRLVYEDWMHSGRTDLVRKHYKLMRDVKSWRFLRRADGLLVTRGPTVVAASDGQKPVDIVDWGMCYRDGFVFRDANAVVNALHYRNLVELAAMARAIGEAADAATFEAEAKATFAAYQKALFDSAAGCYRDGEGTDHKTVQANAMALACGVVPPECVSRVADYVSKKGFSCSTYMAQFVLEALFRAGRADRAFELMTDTGHRSWMGMMAKGATVTMEFWDLTLKERGRVPDMNHAWSTAPANMISRFVLGVEPSAPGWSAVTIRPNPGPLARLSGKVPTKKGAVSLEMKKASDGSWSVAVDTPVPAHFAFGGLEKNLSAGCTTLRVKAQPPKVAFDTSLAVLISDLHVNGEKATHTSAELKKTVDAILAMRPLPAHVVMMGDVADTHGRACDYAAADPLLKPLEDAGVAVDWMLGNHDHRAAFAAFRPAYAKSTLVPGRQVHVVSLPSFDLVLLDSLVESEGDGAFSEVNGEVDGGQREWLADFGAHAQRPFIVCTHHDGRQMKAFAKYAMTSSPKMCGYLHGHRHSWMPDALHVWGKDARLVRSAGVPSAAAWGDVGFALLRDCGDRAELTAVIRDGWFPKPPATDATRRIARENNGARVVFPFGGAAPAAERAPVPATDLARAAYDDSLEPILPGWGRHFWNRKSVWYLYPPAFDFTNVANAVSYRFEITTDRHDRLAFTAGNPTESLKGVWSRIPARGLVTVSCFGIAADGRICGEAGSPRTFWKNPPFDPARCEPGVSTYAEAALRQYEYVFSLPHVAKMVETGKLDYTYPHNCYPTKMNACLIASALRYGELKPTERERALKIACAAADCLIDLAEPEGAPLAGFTPTYAKDSKLHSAGRYAGQNMLCYPATSGRAFLTLHAATGQAKYLVAAKRIADTYLRLQGTDGTWYLKLWEKDGKPVNPNRLLPIGVCGFLLECSRVSGDPKYRAAADRAFAYVENGPLANWNWEGQFEDVEPSEKYQNLTHHPPCDAALFLLDRYPGDKARLAQARALLRFSEDQFVAWERPCRSDGTTVHHRRLEPLAAKWPVLPVTLEQYSWYVPVNASLAKMIYTYLDLYKAERNPLDLAKAKALGDACTRAQCDSGCIPSEWMGPIDRKTSCPTWINCQIETAEALEALAGDCEAKTAVDPESFRRPPSECRPRCWWAWMNGNVTKAGISRDLTEMVKLGIGGVTVFDLGGGVVAGPVEGYAPAWYEHIRFAGEEAARLGIDLCVHNCSGWTASGAPWITPENSMKRLVTGDITLKPGERFRGKIPLDGTIPHDWVREVSLIAYPAPEAEKVAPPPVDFVREGTNRYVLTLPQAYDVTGFEFRHRPNTVWEWMRTAFFTVESDDGAGWRKIADLRLELFNNGFPLAREERLAVPLGKTVCARRFRFTFDAPNAIGNVYELAELRLTCNSKVVPDVKARSLAFRQGFAPIPAAPDAVIDAGTEYLDVSRFLKPDGTFEWTAPETGRLWIVQRTAAVSTGARNGPVCDRRQGLECDKLDKRGVDAVYEGYVGRLRGMKGLTEVLCDSWEVGSQNWTDILPDEFAKRRGYRVDRYWPAFSGRIVGSPQATDRFFRDWRKTIAELFTENYASRFRELAHRDGLRYLCEPYGNFPADAYAYARAADLPMSEFWVHPPETYARNEKVDENTFPDERCIRTVASAVHFHGKAFADAESFTCAPGACGKWRKGPSILKACGDAALAAGINRFTYHSITHQPWLDRYLPGAVMNVFGTVTELNSPMWPMMKPMVAYHTRLHYLLSRGRSASRLLYIAPDDQLAAFPKAGFPADISYDIVGADDAALVKTENGRIVAPSGVTYEALVLAADEAYEYASAAEVKRLLSSGVRVFREGETAFAGITRDFRCTGTAARVRSIRRDYADGASGWFIACPDTNAVTLACSFAVQGRFPELWDAETGERRRLTDFREENGRTLLTLALDPCGSAFVYFSPRPDASLRSVRCPRKPRVIQDLSRFTLTFPNGWGCGGPYALERPVSWTTLGGETQYFSGTAFYETTFDHRTAGDVVLDLGEVRETAEVLLDGKSVGILWKPPYRIDLTERLRNAPGVHTLRIAVANSWANRLIGDAKKPDDCVWWENDWRAGLLKEMPAWVKEGKPSPTGRYTFSLVRHYKGTEPLLPAGLLGPVRLLSEEIAL